MFATDLPHQLLSVGRKQEHPPAKDVIKLPLVPPPPASLAIVCRVAQPYGVGVKLDDTVVPPSIGVPPAAVMADEHRVGATRASPSGEPPTTGRIIARSFVCRQQ